jgi:hypothetical protein
MDLKEVGWGDVDWIQLAQGWGHMTGSCKHGRIQ